MKKIILLAVLALLIFAAAIFFMGQNRPSQNADLESETVRNITETSDCDALTIITPEENSAISSPVKVEVVVDNSGDKMCRWTVFEAVAGSVAIEDENGRVLGTEILTTAEEWMTENPVTYTAEFPFKDQAMGAKINLVIRETNPSGDDTEDSTITVPLTFSLPSN